MKNFTLLSLVAATLLLTASDDKTKEAVSDATSAVTESAKEMTSNAVDATKDAANAAVEATKAKATEVADAAEKVAEETKAKAAEVAAAAEKKAADAAQALKDRASEANKAVQETVADATGGVDLEAGKAAYAKCAGCHGANGTTKALGKSNLIAGQSASDLEAALHGYKEGTRNVSGMGMLMKGQVASMDDATIKAVSAYMASF